MKKLFTQENMDLTVPDEFSPRWAAWIALFTVVLLYEALPTVFYWGPSRLMLILVTLLAIPMIISHWRKNNLVVHSLSIIINSLITVYVIMSSSRIVFAAFMGEIGPKHLLFSAFILWSANILAFALWYWNLDAGGPHKRDSQEFNGLNAFLFPQKQIMLSDSDNIPSFIKTWKPNFIDYLFVAFNTSTAFSPTDTPVLSRWAKCMTMIQSLISLTIVLVLAARAINIFQTSSYLIS